MGFLARDGAELTRFMCSRCVQGTGRRAAACCNDAKRARQDLGLWTFQANAGAARFISKHGFVEVRRTDGAGNDEGLPDIRFEWQREAA